MRKQTKLVVVFSTTALLAIGSAMSSYAATGWTEENGTWVYYDKSGDKVTEEWKKSGDTWFWLDESGDMAVNQLLEIDNNFYYVGESGAMAANQWVAIVNEEAGDEEEPDRYWYYFQPNGKAFARTESTSESSVATKTINGKKYAFDSDGKMLYGWVKGSERLTGADGWKEADCYFGDENDGSMNIGWKKIAITDEDADRSQPGDEYWDKEQERWFYFQASGKKTKPSESNDKGYVEKNINGKKYGFDEYGRMISSWFASPSIVTTEKASSSTATDSVSQGNMNYSKQFMYFNSPDDGARFTKGWFKVVPGYYLNQGQYEDDEESWFYADGNGSIVANEIKTISGKKYAFDKYGRMMTGLVFLEMADGETPTQIIDKFASDGVEPYDTEAGFEEFCNTYHSEIDAKTIRAYYFGNSDDGAMKIGKQSVSIDGTNISFMFENSGLRKGSGAIGEEKDKLYMAGKQVKASKDDKFSVYKYDVIENTIEKMEIGDFIKECTDTGIYSQNTGTTTWKVKNSVKNNYDNVKYYLINTSGAITKNTSSAKDSMAYKYAVDKYVIQSISLAD